MIIHAIPSFLLAVLPACHLALSAPNQPFARLDSGSLQQPEWERISPIYRNVAYYIDLGAYSDAQNFQASQLPADKLTHVLYAFSRLTSDGTISLNLLDVDTGTTSDGNVYGAMKQLYTLKKNHSHLKVLLSVAGWTFSQMFASAISTESFRSNFTSTAVQLISDLGLDGIDMDWGFPSKYQHSQDLLTLLPALRASLDDLADSLSPNNAVSKPHFEITFAIRVGTWDQYGGYRAIDMGKMDQYLDAWHMLAYDFVDGLQNQVTVHDASLYHNLNNPDSTRESVDDAIQGYKQNGTTMSKVVTGIPLNGRSFQGTDGSNGLGQLFNGNRGPGEWGNIHL